MNGCVYKTADGQCEKFSDPVHNTMSWCLDGPCGDETPSNADLIRAMTDYDLADWIAKILIYHGKVALNEYHVDCDKGCPLYYCCNDQPTDNIEGWLNLPADVESSPTVCAATDCKHNVDGICMKGRTASERDV